MIKRISIKNFQSHKNTVLELSKGVNTIIGRSDSGKSAICRAITFVIENRPAGNSFIRHKSEGTEVGIEFYDGTKVTRSKIIKGKKKKNAYELIRKKGKIEKFSAVSSSVPKEIIKALRIDKEITVQGQHDPTFLLQKTSGEISRFFNQLVEGLELIDPTLKRIEQKRKLIVGEIISAKKSIQKSILKINSLPDISTLEEQAASLEKRLIAAKSSSSKANKMKELVREIQVLKSSKLSSLNVQYMSDSLKAIDRMISDIHKARYKQKEVRDTKQICDDLAVAVSESKKLSSSIKKSKSEYAAILSERALCPLCSSPIRSDLQFVDEKE